MTNETHVLKPLYYAICSPHMSSGRTVPKPVILGFACFDLSINEWSYERQNGDLDAVDRNLTLAELEYVTGAIKALAENK